MSADADKGIRPLRRIEVAAGIVWRGREVLCCQRPEGREQAGFWEFPGGKLNKGETAKAALARELSEELDLTVEHCAFWLSRTHCYTDLSLEVTLHFFHVTAFSGTPRALDGQRFAWVDCGQAKDLDFLPADRDLVARLATLSGTV